MVCLRKAVREDASAIRKLIWRVGINPLGLNWQRFLVAVDERGQVIGCGQIKPHRDGSCELASIAVQPEWQGRGIGRRIIERMLTENQPPLYLTCTSRNEPFYQKFGFRTISTEEFPPYFRRIYRLTVSLSRFFPQMGQILVMLKTA